MAPKIVLDFDRLLKPVSDDAPAGEALRVADRSTYSDIRRIRDLLSKAEKIGEPPEDEDADWDQVFEKSERAIAETSKDLIAASWLIESLIRLHGFAGLRDGLRLVRELTEFFWDSIHPRPDEDGLETTMRPLSGLDGTLIGPLANVPVTEGRSAEPLALWHYCQALELEQKEPDEREQRLADGWVGLDQFEKAVAGSSADFYRDLLEDLSQCQQELQALGTALDEKCGRNDDGYPLAPSTSRIRESLEDAYRTIRGFAKDVLGIEGQDDGSEDSVTEGGGTARSERSAKDVQNREEAFQSLLEIAKFFRRTEPHSPVSYAIEQAVRWGRMSLPDLLGDLISDSTSKENLFRHVGLPQTSNDEDE